MEIINKRRSVRLLKDKIVEDDKIELILRAAMQAPSAMNQQPWRFLVVKDKEKLKKAALSGKVSKTINNGPCAIVLYIDSNNLLTEAMSPLDLSAAMENLLLEATSLKIGSVWIGIYPREERIETIKEIFGYKEGFIPFAVAVLGYPVNDDAFNFVDRYDESKVFFEKF